MSIEICIIHAHIQFRNKRIEQEIRHLGPEIIALRFQKRFGVVISLFGIGKYRNSAGLIPQERQRRIPKKIRLKPHKIFHNISNIIFFNYERTQCPDELDSGYPLCWLVESA